MRVLVKQLSGLGNQLFQYAAGLHFARRFEADLEILTDHDSAQALSHGKYARPFLLPQFSIEAPVRTTQRIDHVHLGERQIHRILASPLSHITGTCVLRESVTQRYRFLERPPVPSGTRNLYLVGYWQAWQYAASVEEDLRRHFRLRAPANGANASVLHRIQDTEIPVSLHVRRGDYTLAAEGNIALPMSFYRSAIDAILERYPRAVFFVFSDDTDFARAHLPADIQRVFVEGNDDFASFEDMRLMSACRHHIIANSSFSWWGAWLNPLPDKTVIAPQHWQLTTESDYPDLLPPSWLRLPSLRQT